MHFEKLSDNQIKNIERNQSKYKLSNNQKENISKRILDLIHEKQKLDKNNHERNMAKKLIKCYSRKSESSYVIITKRHDIYFVNYYSTNKNKTPACKIWKLKHNGIMYNIFRSTIKNLIREKKVGVIYE